MYPELFHIGPIPIRSYGVMLVISFFAGVLYMKYVSKRYNKSFETYLNIAYIMIFGGIIGARLAYVLLEPLRRYPAGDNSHLHILPLQEAVHSRSIR